MTGIEKRLKPEDDGTVNISLVLQNASMTDDYQNSVLRKKDRQWAGCIDVEEVSASYKHSHVLQELANRGLFFCHAEMMNTLRNRIRPEEWGELLARDILVDENEATLLVDCSPTNRHENKSVL